MHRTLCAILVLFTAACADTSEPTSGAQAGGEVTADEPGLDEPRPEAPGGETPLTGGCARAGCSSQLCVPEGEERMTTCEFRPEYACYRDARCERQPDGSCGFTPSPELEACLAHPPAE
jgi:hypothetical protein